MIEEASPWTEEQERLFRRDVLLNAPERAAHLEPFPRLDWLAAMSIRELAPPPVEPYRGEERRRSGMR
jgi:hypothetical protein